MAEAGTGAGGQLTKEQLLDYVKRQKIKIKKLETSLEEVNAELAACKAASATAPNTTSESAADARPAAIPAESDASLIATLKEELAALQQQLDDKTKVEFSLRKDNAAQHTALDEAERSIARLEQSLKDSEEQLLSERQNSKSCESELDNLRAENSKLLESIKDLEKRIDLADAEGQLKMHRELMAIRSQEAEELQEAKAKCADLSTSLEDVMKASSSLQADYHSLQQKYESQKQTWEHAEAESKQSAAEAVTLREKLAQSNAVLVKVKENLDAHNQESSKLKRDLQEAQARLETEAQRRSEEEAQRGRDLDHDAKISGLEARVSELVTSLEQEQSALSALREERERAESQCAAEAERSSQELAALTSEIAFLRAEVASLSSASQSSSTTAEGLAAQVAAAESALASARSDLSACEEKLHASTEKGQKLSALTKTKMREIETLSARVKELEQQQTLSAAESSRSQIEEMKILCDKNEALAVEVETLSASVSSLKETHTSELQKVRDQLSSVVVERDEREVQLADLNAKLQVSLDEAAQTRNDLAVAQVNAAELKRDLQEAQARLETEAQRRSEEEAQRGRDLDHDAKISGLEARVSELVTSLEQEQSALSALREERERAESQCAAEAERSSQELAALTSEIASLRAEVASLSSASQSSSTTAEGLAAQVAAAESALASARSDLSACEEKLHASTEKGQKLSALTKTKMREIETLSARVKEQDEKLVEAEMKSATATKEIEVLRQQNETFLKEIEAVSKQSARADEEITIVREEREALRRQMLELEGQVDDLRENLDSLQVRHEQTLREMDEQAKRSFVPIITPEMQAEKDMLLSYKKSDSECREIVHNLLLQVQSGLKSISGGSFNRTTGESLKEECEAVVTGVASLTSTSVLNFNDLVQLRKDHAALRTECEKLRENAVKFGEVHESLETTLNDKINRLKTLLAKSRTSITEKDSEIASLKSATRSLARPSSFCVLMRVFASVDSPSEVSSSVSNVWCLVADTAVESSSLRWVQEQSAKQWITEGSSLQPPGILSENAMTNAFMCDVMASVPSDKAMWPPMLHELMRSRMSEIESKSSSEISALKEELETVNTNFHNYKSKAQLALKRAGQDEKSELLKLRAEDEKKFEAMALKIDELTTQLSSSRGETGELQSKILSLEEAIYKSATELADFEAQAKILKTQMEECKLSCEALEKQRDDLTVIKLKLETTVEDLEVKLAEAKTINMANTVTNNSISMAVKDSHGSAMKEAKDVKATVDVTPIKRLDRNTGILATPQPVPGRKFQTTPLSQLLGDDDDVSPEQGEAALVAGSSHTNAMSMSKLSVDSIPMALQNHNLLVVQKADAERDAHVASLRAQVAELTAALEDCQHDLNLSREQTQFLKRSIRDIENEAARAKELNSKESPMDTEYIVNILRNVLMTKDSSEHAKLIPVLCSLLHFSAEDTKHITELWSGAPPASRASGLVSWLLPTMPQPPILPPGIKPVMPTDNGESARAAWAKRGDVYGTGINWT